MRILYGVCGEGMGHAIRSAVVADHLRSQGHSLLFVTSGRALDYLTERYPGAVLRVPGLTISKGGGEVQAFDTIVKNMVHQALGAVFEAPTAAAAVLRFRPEAVVSDFEPWSARYARLWSTPLYAVDSIHFLSRFRHPREFVTVDTALTLPVVDAMVPFARHYFVVAPVFVSAASTHLENTTLHLPVLRPEILAARRERLPVADHLTVYLNDLVSSSNALNVLADSKIPCHVWSASVKTLSTTALDRVIRAKPHGRLTYHAFQDDAFIRDLATCRAAVGSAGAGLLSETAALGKPMLALPIGGHWEQFLNGAYHERAGYGESAARLTPSVLASFLERAPFYERNLAAVGHDGNASLLMALDRCLAGAAP